MIIINIHGTVKTTVSWYQAGQGYRGRLIPLSASRAAKRPAMTERKASCPGNSGIGTPSEITVGPSLWGHDRAWLPAEQREQARAMRLKAAQDGQREPVRVIEGNYERMEGVCPWWDGVKGQG